ncbi:hypothetical protein C0989_010526, partial [Termitomyces sp. Mn162]
LSPSADNSYLAYPSPVPSPTPPPSSTLLLPGDVLLFCTRSLTTANALRAHRSPISFLSLISTGTLLATPSTKRPRRREALPVPAWYAQDQDLLDEFQCRGDVVGG